MPTQRRVFRRGHRVEFVTATGWQNKKQKTKKTTAVITWKDFIFLVRPAVMKNDIQLLM